MLARPSNREAILMRISEIRAGASQISRFLADETLMSNEWEQAVRILAGCREERRILEDSLRHFDGR